MAKLTSIDLPDATDKKGRKTIPTVKLVTPEGDVVKRYNEACDAATKAEATITELTPILRKAGLTEVFNTNCTAESTKDRISSVNIVDVKMGVPEHKQEPNGEICMLTWTKKDVKNDAKAVETAFNALRTTEDKRPNVNNYVRWMPVASFDSSAFIVNDRFDEERYNEFNEAIALVAKRLGIDNPLSCARILKPVADFHETIRWQQFDGDANAIIHSVLPTQVNLKAIRPEANGVAGK